MDRGVQQARQGGGLVATEIQTPLETADMPYRYEYDDEVRKLAWEDFCMTKNELLQHAHNRKFVSGRTVPTELLFGCWLLRPS